MTFTEPADPCAICGNTDKRDLRTSLAHWLEAPQGMSYSHVMRCIDVAACRARVEASGKPWLLVTAKEDLRAV